MFLVFLEWLSNTAFKQHGAWKNYGPFGECEMVDFGVGWRVTKCFQISYTFLKSFEIWNQKMDIGYQLYLVNSFSTHEWWIYLWSWWKKFDLTNKCSRTMKIANKAIQLQGWTQTQLFIIKYVWNAWIKI